MAKIPYIKEAVKNLFMPPVTENYPKVPIKVPENYRGRIKFNAEKCLGCGMCIKVCSPGAITKTVEAIEDGQKITMRFELGSCTFCQMCSDFCAKKCIELTQEYSMVSEDKNTLFEEGSFIKKLPPKPPIPGATAKAVNDK